MVDQAGHAQAWRAQRGKPRVVSMFYTSCPYMCPLIVDSGKAVEHQLTPAERDRIGITLVSLDPARDTPKALQALAGKRQLDARRWSLLAPRADDVRAIAGVLGVRYRQLANGEFNHSSELILLDADGRILARSDKVGSVPDPAFVARGPARTGARRERPLIRLQARAWPRGRGFAAADRHNRRCRARPRARVRACPRRRSGDSIPGDTARSCTRGCMGTSHSAGDLIEVKSLPAAVA